MLEEKIPVKKNCSGIFYFFFFLLLLLEAMRESLCFLLRTGRWIRYWRFINSGILSLQIRPELPTFYFLLVKTKPGNAHGSAYTYMFICVYDRIESRCRAVGWTPRKLVHIAASVLTSTATLLHWPGLKLHTDKVMMLAVWMETLIQPDDDLYSGYEVLGYMAQR